MTRSALNAAARRAGKWIGPVSVEARAADLLIRAVDHRAWAARTEQVGLWQRRVTRAASRLQNVAVAYARARLASEHFIATGVVTDHPLRLAGARHA